MILFDDTHGCICNITEAGENNKTKELTHFYLKIPTNLLGILTGFIVWIRHKRKPFELYLL